MSDREFDPGKVTAPIHPEKIPAPPEDGEEENTDPGRARWEKVVRDAIRSEISSHETKAHDRYLTILARFALGDERWDNHEKRIGWLERHGVPRASMILLLVAVALLGAQVYFEYARLELARQSPGIGALR